MDIKPQPLFKSPAKKSATAKPPLAHERTNDVLAEIDALLNEQTKDVT